MFWNKNPGTFVGQQPRVRAPGDSKLEQVLLAVPALQETLSAQDLVALAPVSFTCKAIADDPHPWRLLLAQEVRVDCQRLPSPIDGYASLMRDNSSRPYKDIITGIRLIDGEKGLRVPHAEETDIQRAQVVRACNFLEANVPGYLTAVLDRHFVHALRGDQERSAEAGLAVGAVLTATYVGAIGGVAKYHVQNILSLTPAKAGNNVILSKLVGMIGIKATKALFLYSTGYWTVKALFLALNLGRFTHAQYNELQRLWRVRERELATANIHQAMASLRANVS